MTRVLLLITVVSLALSAGSADADHAPVGSAEWFWIDGLADFDNDCDVDIDDAQAVSFRWATYYGDIYYDTRHDVYPYDHTGEYDWQIDIYDTQTVMGRVDITCAMVRDPKDFMGEYSLTSGSEQPCKQWTRFPIVGPDKQYYVDPITVIFYPYATAANLEREAQEHGFPHLASDDEQRFWENGHCTFEDVDAAQNSLPTLTGFHFRAEMADQELGYPYTTDHIVWGKYAAATPHYDDSGFPFCSHYVPEVYPYPWLIGPGFTGSGFDAGREWVKKKFVDEGPHIVGWQEYWGNSAQIYQSCGGDQPYSNGDVYFIEIFPP